MARHPKGLSHANLRRTKSEYAILPFVGTRKSCTVSFQDSGGVRHAVEVGADTLYEAAVLALKAFREHDCAPGAASQLEVEVRSLSVTHFVSIAKVQDWLRSSAKRPERQDHQGTAEGLARVIARPEYAFR